MTTISVFTIGGGDLIQQVFNAVAVVFNNKEGISALTGIAVMFGGLFATFQFSQSRDVTVLIRWVGMYVLVTSLILYPKATVVIEDRTGLDIKPRIVDHVPLSLALFAGFTSRIGIGLTEMVETVFHMPDDMSYNKTGMLMGSKLMLAAKNFQLTDAEFSQTLNEFMQQCVFFDLLLRKYTVQDLIHADNPWNFIKTHTSRARAFPLNGEITVCNVGAARLDQMWQAALRDAATVYGGRILGNHKDSAKLLLSHLSNGYSFLTNVSVQGDALLQTNLLSNALSQALSHYSANSNAPAALQAYADTKSELQARETMDQTGRQAGVWMQHFKNIIEAVLYSSFIFIYFLSYFPFGGAIIRNYLMGLFALQALAPMYAIINFAANYFAQNRSMAFLSSDTTHAGSSIATLAGITQANADAMAVAGYLIWPVTLGGAMMLFRGMPAAIQSMGQLMGGVVQHTGSHVASESIGGNISAGNANFGNRSLYNTNANHFDTNVRYAAGGATFQTGTGSSVSITPSGSEVLDNRGGLSNLGISVHMAESIRSVASRQAQSSLSAAFNQSQSAGQHYSAAIRQMDDYARQQSHFESSGKSHTSTDSSGLSQSAHTVAQLVDSFAKEHHVSHERAAQVLGQVYADTKSGIGASLGGSMSGRSAFGSLYNQAHRFAVDHNLSETVDSAHRAAVESHFRDSNDQGNRYAHSIASSFDKGDQFRTEASNQFSKAESYSTLASTSTESAASINANYTQAFYEWMRTQPAPSSQYGQGTWSRSAIDEMAVHDPAKLQGYADRFVSEKTNGYMQSFNQSHHLTGAEKTIEADYHLANQNLSNQATVAATYAAGNEVVQQAMRFPQNSVGSVDKNIQADVNQNMKNNETHLSRHQNEMVDRAVPLQEKIEDKVKGKVFGSLLPSHDTPKRTLDDKNKLLSIMERENKND